MYPVEIEIKDTTESNISASYLDLLLSIEREVNFILPFMTNETISIYILQIFRSWVAIFQLRPPMACFYLTAYTICRGLLLVWMFYSEGGDKRQTEIHEWTLEIVIEGIFIVDTGILRIIWSSPRRNVKWDSVKWSSTMTTLHWSDYMYIQIRDLITELDLLSNYERFS